MDLSLELSFSLSSDSVILNNDYNYVTFVSIGARGWGWSWVIELIDVFIVEFCYVEFKEEDDLFRLYRKAILFELLHVFVRCWVEFKDFSISDSIICLLFWIFIKFFLLKFGVNTESYLLIYIYIFK